MDFIVFLHFQGTISMTDCVNCKKYSSFMQAVLHRSLFSCSCEQTLTQICFSLPARGTCHHHRWHCVHGGFAVIFLFSPQPSQTVLSNCRHFTEGKHSSYIQDGTEQMPATSLLLTDLNCSQREQHCELYFFFCLICFLFCSLRKILLIIALSKQTTTIRLLD